MVSDNAMSNGNQIEEVSPNDGEMNEHTAFRELGPDQILDAVESQDYLCDGRFIALNSYENRVYQIGLEEQQPIIAKFYRPERWSDEAIIEEHEFTISLEAEDIPVVAPLRNAQGKTLHHHGPFRFALYPRRGGRSPELDNSDHLEIIGRFIARIHLHGQSAPFEHRATINTQNFGREPADYLLGSRHIPMELQRPYAALIDNLLVLIQQRMDEAGELDTIRLHGDFHAGNILWRDDVPHIVDFDDARNGPAVQDIWMMLSGDRQFQTARLGDLLEGYTQFRDFDPRELRLIEPLRTLRMIHYAAWVAKRWEDPAFQLAFPWFASARYWDDHILSLREQEAALTEPPLIWD